MGDYSCDGNCLVGVPTRKYVSVRLVCDGYGGDGECERSAKSQRGGSTESLHECSTYLDTSDRIVHEGGKVGGCWALATIRFLCHSRKSPKLACVNTRFVNLDDLEGLDSSPVGSSVRLHTVWYLSHVRKLDSSCFVLTDCWVGE